MKKQLFLGLIASGAALVLAACGGSAPADTATATPRPASASPTPMASALAPTTVAAASPQAVPEYVVNVYFTNTGPEPADIFIPLGQRVRLVLRNRDYYEHHYRVIGLEPADLLWILQPDAPLSDTEIDDLNATAAAGGTSTSVDDHHHGGGVVYFRDPSDQGIQPLGDEVHGYAEPGGIDTVLFTPTNLGTFQVEDPLYPDFKGTVTVFQPVSP